MDSTVQLIDMLGAGALIIWGLQSIKKGILRAFGASLRGWIAKSTGNRLAAAVSGLLATIAVQSSTATAVITGSFASRGIIDTRMAQAVMLGANVGTAITAAALSLNLHWLAFALIFVGVVVQSQSDQPRGKGVGRAILGLGLMLLALQLMEAATEPLRASALIGVLLDGLANAPIFAILFAAGLAFVSSSSLAVVLFIAALAKGGDMAPALVVLLVAGANLGGAVPPFLAVAKEGIEARRLTLSNMFVRAFGTLVLLVLAGPIADLLATVAPRMPLAIAAHLGFNLALIVVFLPLLDPVARLVEMVLPRSQDQERQVNHLDEGILDTPSLALAGAAREALLVGDLVHEMLERSLNALKEPDLKARDAIASLDDEVDSRQHAIKLYVAKLKTRELSDEEQRRCDEIISYAINLEHVGDIVDRNLSRAVAKCAERQVRFSDAGRAEIIGLYEKSLANMQLAQSVFLTRKPELARQLMEAKVEVRHYEFNSLSRHMARVQEQRLETLESSTLHLDILRDLKSLNAHLASVAYPILDEMGVLRESRLRSPKKAEKKPAAF